MSRKPWMKPLSSQHQSFYSIGVRIDVNNASEFLSSKTYCFCFITAVIVLKLQGHYMQHDRV